MKILIVANPVAGGRGKGRGVRRLAEHLEARGHEVELYWTRGPGDAAKRVRALPDDLDRIVVAMICVQSLPSHSQVSDRFPPETCPPNITVR